MTGNNNNYADNKRCAPFQSSVVSISSHNSTSAMPMSKFSGSGVLAALRTAVLRLVIDISHRVSDLTFHGLHILRLFLSFSLEASILEFSLLKYLVLPYFVSIMSSTVSSRGLDIESFPGGFHPPAVSNRYDAATNPTGVISFAMAENVRSMLLLPLMFHSTELSFPTVPDPR
jgi:hypothetical protein